jgi:gliding motility-associated-like protein
MRYNRQLYIFLFLLFPAILEAQVDFNADVTEGCSNLTVNFTLVAATPPTTVSWNFGNGITSDLEVPPPVSYSEPGVYTVSVIVDGTIDTTKTDFIFVRPLPDARIFYSDSLVTGSYIYIFTAAPEAVDSFTYSYAWTFDDATTATTSRVVHEYDSTGTYPVSLQVTDDFGCIDSSTRTVAVTDKLIVPNVFTPNNDTWNDILEIPTNGISKYVFQIFSRSGMQVYKSESFWLEWDGYNLSGVLMSPGIYYYTIRSLDPANPLEQKGFFYLIR